MQGKYVVFMIRGTTLERRHEETGFFAYVKTKTQISFAVTAKLVSAFVFATHIVQPLYFLYTKFQASSYLVWLYSLVCVGPGRKPRRPVFSQRGSLCCLITQVFHAGEIEQVGRGSLLISLPCPILSGIKSTF